MTNESENKIKITQKKETLITVAILIAALVSAFLVSSFIVSLGIVNGPSMEDSFKDGDIIIIWKLFDEIKKGDVVVCRLPELTRGTIIKRVAACSGDYVLITRGGELYVNSEYVITFAEGTYKEMELEVPTGEYFLLGDNPEESIDSRDSSFGTVKEESIEGKVVLGLFS